MVQIFIDEARFIPTQRGWRGGRESSDKMGRWVDRKCCLRVTDCRNGSRNCRRCSQMEGNCSRCFNDVDYDEIYRGGTCLEVRCSATHHIIIRVLINPGCKLADGGEAKKTKTRITHQRDASGSTGQASAFCGSTRVPRTTHSTPVTACRLRWLQYRVASHHS